MAFGYISHIDKKTSYKSLIRKNFECKLGTQSLLSGRKWNFHFYFYEDNFHQQCIAKELITKHWEFVSRTSGAAVQICLCYSHMAIESYPSHHRAQLILPVSVCLPELFLPALSLEWCAPNNKDIGLLHGSALMAAINIDIGCCSALL